MTAAAKFWLGWFAICAAVLLIATRNDPLVVWLVLIPLGALGILSGIRDANEGDR